MHYSGTYLIDAGCLCTLTQAQITLDPTTRHIVLSGPWKNSKRFHFQTSSFQQTQNPAVIILEALGSRPYRVKNFNPTYSVKTLLLEFKKHFASQQNLQNDKNNLNQNYHLNQPLPQILIPKLQNQALVNLHGLRNSHFRISSYFEQVTGPELDPTLSAPERTELVEQPLEPQNLQVTLRAEHVINPGDWALTDKGYLDFINDAKIENLRKVLVWLIKKVFTNGSFLGISIPTFIMRPESMLQNIARCFGAAPQFLEGKKTLLDRLKGFTCFIFQFSVMFTDMYKPFNPVLGETFQATISGCPIYCEQISHHPPISSVYFLGKGYKVWFSVELDAKLSINSATGVFYGDIHIQYDDDPSSTVIGRLPNGCVENMAWGRPRFKPVGGIYCYDSRTRILAASNCSYLDQYSGIIGKLNSRKQLEFDETLRKRSRFYDFKAPQLKDYSEVLAEYTGHWMRGVSFKEECGSDYSDPAYFPVLLTKQKQPLPSDSNFRKDIQELGEGKVEESQAAKEEIENQQRQDAKLRKRRQGSR